MRCIDGIPVNELERRMQPGGWSEELFLMQNQSLVRIIAADSASLQELGVNSHKISSSLGYLLDRKACNEISCLVSNIKVRTFHNWRMITCPWAKKQFEWCNIGRGAELLTSEDFEIKNMQLGESIDGLTLSIHLIRDHNFFGGPGTKYRIDPKKIVRVLELE